MAWKLRLYLEDGSSFIDDDDYETEEDAIDGYDSWLENWGAGAETLELAGEDGDRDGDQDCDDRDDDQQLGHGEAFAALLHLLHHFLHRYILLYRPSPLARGVYSAQV